MPVSEGEPEQPSDTSSLLRESRRLQSLIRALDECPYAQALPPLPIPPPAHSTPRPLPPRAPQRAEEPPLAPFALPSAVPETALPSALPEACGAPPSALPEARDAQPSALLTTHDAAETKVALSLGEREALLCYAEQKLRDEKARLDRREAALGEIALRLRSRNERAVQIQQTSVPPAAPPRPSRTLSVAQLAAAAAAAAGKSLSNRAERLSLPPPSSSGPAPPQLQCEDGDTAAAGAKPLPTAIQDHSHLSSEGLPRAKADAPHTRNKPGRPSPAGSGL